MAIEDLGGIRGGAKNVGRSVGVLGTAVGGRWSNNKMGNMELSSGLPAEPHKGA